MKFDVNLKKISSRVFKVLLEEYSIIQSCIQHTLRSKISRVVENLFHFHYKIGPKVPKGKPENNEKPLRGIFISIICHNEI